MNRTMTSLLALGAGALMTTMFNRRGMRRTRRRMMRMF
ncbi:DUF3918 family protein [Bacillus sp. CLL-7-23]|uniref:DUF3918 family protein n=1 Tax=Bacillus changyiensis TaxID=3004103 RepID=A0ABT4X5V0_9BACI|nr:DUF3918 family protein [Bacillus changyiensis]MDA7027671.1 DUF3918 family protein [Bacillus changyiensis]